MRLTASIVTYRTDLLELEKVLDLVARSCVEKVFVIDNARQKGVEDLCARFPGCVYIPSANRGYGAGHNRAIEKAMQEGGASSSRDEFRHLFFSGLSGSSRKIYGGQSRCGLPSAAHSESPR